MNSRALAIALVFAALVVGAVLFVMSRPPATEPSVVEEAPAADERAAAAESVAPAAPATPPRAPAPRASAAPAAPPPREAPVPSRATLRVESDVPGASVFLDREFIGRTPVTARNLAPGRKQLNVSAEGFEGVAQTIELEPGERDITVRLRDVRLNAAVDVVHRHRVGSCRGRLVADPRGVRYDTDHPEDGFRASLDEIQTFEVDYLESNLQLRLRNGRTYNFTSPDGSADPLFVFHRDVTQARERLAAGASPGQ